MARILIAEDSDTEVAFLREILQSSPHDLTFARDGLEAEAAARLIEYDLIVLDALMPGKNGFTVCDSLKSDPPRRQVPIILLTAKSEVGEHFWGAQQGADACLSKPYAPARLLEEIGRQLAAPH